MTTVNQDLHPSKSLDLIKPTSIDFEILDTGNVIIWEASALNPSHYEVFVDSGPRKLVRLLAFDYGATQFKCILFTVKPGTFVDEGMVKVTWRKSRDG